MKLNANHSLFASAALALSLAACSSAPKQIESLETARAAYSQSSENEKLVQHAPTELSAAHDALNEADRLWKNDADRPDIEHYANLVSQKLQIAELVADQKIAEQQLGDKKAQQQETQVKLAQARTTRAHQAAIAFDKQVSDMHGRSTHRGIVTTLSDELFEANSGTLAPAAGYKITTIVNFLKKNPKRRAIIEAHTDNAGDADDNLDLSRERAYSVRAALKERGIDADRLRALGFGGSAPIESNSTAKARQANRRVEITFPNTPMYLSSAK